MRSIFLELGYRWRPDPFVARSYAGLAISSDPATSTSTRTAAGYGPFGMPDPMKVLELARAFTLTIDELPTLLAGDVVFTRTEVVGPVKEWLVSFLIRVVTFTRKDKRPTAVNHTATIVRPVYEVERTLLDGREVHFGPVVDYVVAEALGKGGYQERRLLEVYGDERKYQFAVARCKLTNDHHREKMLEAGASLLGRQYGYWKIAAHFADSILTRLFNLAGARGDVYAFRRLCRMKRYPICSWSTLYIYRKAGIPFTTPVASGSPDDIWDECRRKAMVIWAFPFCSERLKESLFGPGFGDMLGGRTA